MNSQGAVDARAVNAQEHTIRDACPAGVFGCAVKTCLYRNSIYVSQTIVGLQLAIIFIID